jgi:hypothetical protein
MWPMARSDNLRIETRMARYEAVVVHGKREGEGHYLFEGPDHLMTRTPVRVMRELMETIDAQNGIGHMDYEINAAMRNRDYGIVTIIGEMIFEAHGTQPFMCMIAPAEKADKKP